MPPLVLKQPKEKTCYRAIMVEYKSGKCMHEHLCMCEYNLYRATEPQNTEDRLKLNWPLYLNTNELPHLPLVAFLQSSLWLGDKRELTGSQKQITMDTHPGYLTRAIIIPGWLRRRHSRILRIYVRSETEKNSMTNVAVSPCLESWNLTH